MPLSPVPPSLLARPFSTADAEAVGLTRRQLQSSRFRRLYRDVYVAASQPDTLALRCDGALLVLPKEVGFSHHTAALLRRLPYQTPVSSTLEFPQTRTWTSEGYGRTPGCELPMSAWSAAAP
jgi:hypothetical protein